MADTRFARRACSFQAQAQVPINGLTPRQAIKLIGQMRGGRRQDVWAAADRLIDSLELGEWRDVDGLRLSGGLKRLVSFAMAAVVPGRLVMLDEPTNDVDPVRRRLLWRLVLGLADDGAAVLLVTHNVPEAERSVDRLAILDRGRVMTEGTPAALKAGLADDLRLEVVLEPGVESPSAPPWAGSVLAQGHRMLLTVPSAQAPEAIAWADGLRRDGRAEEFSLVPVSLEDVYVAVVGRAEALANGEGEDADAAADGAPGAVFSGERAVMSALRSYRLLLTWQALRLKMYAPILMIVQALFALGIVIGYPHLFPEIDRTTILFLATGAPAITLITVGLVMVPQVVSQARTEGTLDYMRSMPIPRLVYLAADLTIWLSIVMPGVVAAIVIAAIRFNLDFQVSPLVVPGLLLVALSASSVGYAISSVLPQMAANVISQVLVVFVLRFSPLNFPVDRLPDWLATIHSVLPVQAMGEIIRGTIAGGPFPITAGSFLMLAAWTVAGFGLTDVAMTRRA